ncbi:hypothetical protein C6P44_004770 [Monosporozyma unispora]|nr:hypothetical protein C6P44_004770 [Kazachstania unispora]
MNLQQWYSLAVEYETVAHENVGILTDPKQVEQYYKLIDMAIQTLIRLKSNGQWSLTLQQDLTITMRLVKLLLNETLNIDMAENYLSSFLERLQNHPLDLAIWNQQNLIQYWLIYEIPIRRHDRFHVRIAVRNYQDLIATLQDSNMDPYYQNFWISIFEYAATQLYIKLQKYKLAQLKLESLIRNDELKTTHPRWYIFIYINYLNLLLEQRLYLSDEILQTLTQDNLFSDCSVMGPTLYSWKLLLQLIIMINKDLNITPILNEFKQFFETYKEELSGNDELNLNVFNITLDDAVNMTMKISSFLSYKDIKLLLLFLQSVSYLVNCYDKNLQFSVKFLPKVESSLRQIIHDKTFNISCRSLLMKDENLQWYTDLLKYSKFYSIWEKLLLNGGSQLDGSLLQSIDNDDNCFLPLQMIKSVPLNPFYKDLIQVTRKQLNIPFIIKKEIENNTVDECLNDYNKIIISKSNSIEIKLISLLNSYILIVSKIDEKLNSKPTSERQTQIMKANEIWHQLDTVYGKDKKTLDVNNNAIWECTVVIIWIITHFEPFSWNPLPSNDEEKTYYMDKLRTYYINNKIVSKEDDTTDSKYILKRTLLLRILINYLGGKLFETDLDILCQISLKCFKFAKQDKHLINIRYIIGLWHLMNCTVAMKPKEVAYTTAKLEQLVQQMVTSSI